MTTKTVTVEFNHDEVQQTLSALQMWAKHINQTAGVLPANMPGVNATNSAYSKLLAKHYGPGGTRGAAA